MILEKFLGNSSKKVTLLENLGKFLTFVTWDAKSGTNYTSDLQACDFTAPICRTVAAAPGPQPRRLATILAAALGPELS